MEDITDRQKEILTFIQRTTEERGFPPTIREIGEEMDIRSTNGVNDHLKALERKGFLTRGEQQSRSLVPTKRARMILGLGSRKNDPTMIDGVGRSLDLVVLKKNGCVHDFSYVSPAGLEAEHQAEFDALVAGFRQERAP